MSLQWVTVLNKYREQMNGSKERSRFISLHIFEKESSFSFFTEQAGMLFNHTGSLEYQIGDDEYKILNQGEHLFYPKGVTLTIEVKEECFCTQFYLKKEIIEQFIWLLKQYGNYPTSIESQPYRICIFQQPQTKLIDHLLEEQIHSYFELKQDHDFFISLSLCKIMYYIFPDEHMLSKIVYLVETPFYPEEIQRVEAYMLENYHQPIRMKQLLEVAMVSESNLNRLYKKHFNLSPMERLTAIRMEQAALLLRDSSTTITEVAVQVGYQSMSAFVQQFKKKFGVSPKKYQSSK
ncbi:helix-turn-helix transcriptional regulator [Bacillus luteolus]|uniref:Helix-turn-helix transcriptional regulator n=1 Tax=Litchfieldia luteola TaxID=682179 RepID=A0ABR9QMU9_9BACI|nr:AraC family transcriptional regulator [Cytobacillus luteolus]MBE4909774.1 helix-turn-helix transcriptional regulator [Cytobacillus luteolus]MBP1942684.1 AraC-like DNA-binding protein [Cytobacillus luteolus]